MLKMIIFVYLYTNRTLKATCCPIIDRYPGGPLLNPLGLARDIKTNQEWKLKEIKNGLFRFTVLCWLPTSHLYNFLFMLLGLSTEFSFFRTPCNGSHAWNLCSSFCNSCRPYRQPRGAPFQSMAQNCYSNPC